MKYFIENDHITLNERISFWWSEVACTLQTDVTEILASQSFCLTSLFFITQFFNHGPLGKLEWSLQNTAEHSKASEPLQDPKESTNNWISRQEEG